MSSNMNTFAWYNVRVKVVILKILIVIFFVSIIGALVFVSYQYKNTKNELSKITIRDAEQIKLIEAKELQKDEIIKQKDAYIVFLEGENSEVNKQLTEEKDKGEKFEEQVSIIGKTIAEIQKIQSTDAELLKKYSKIYFLNENYKPKELASISNDYLANKKSVIEINLKVLPFLNRMISASEEGGASTSIRIISGFRSFDEQKSLKSSYSVTYGAGANKFSADQGYSEHQLGTTVDISSEKLALSYTSLGKSPLLPWMLENAYKYGFILSYPKGNTHYQYEPWHWRFVGVELATDLHDRKINFYDMDQREIDTYIGKLFDDY